MDIPVYDIEYRVRLLEEKVEKLEKASHPPREFVRCEECNCKIKEKDNASNNSVVDKDNSD